MSATIPEPIADLLREVAARGIELRPHGEHLRFRPVAAMPADLRERLRAHKQEVLSLLGNRTPPPAETFRYSDGLLEFGDVPVGWLPSRWAEELRRKAGRCDAIRPDIAERYRAWAEDIERRLPASDEE